MKLTWLLSGIVCLSGASLLTSCAFAQDAASAPVGWRGDGTGIFASAEPAPEWDSDAKKNILWRVKVGESYSSPVAVANRVFVTVEEEKLLCLDAATGKVLWKKDNGFASLPPEMNVKAKDLPTNAGYAAPTPVTDGKFVYASFGVGIVVCCDLEGNRKWVRYLDVPQASDYGRATSPILVDGKLLVTIGHLFALDPATGKTLWEAKDTAEAFGTPCAAKIGDVTVVFTATGDCVRVSDGRVLEKELGSLLYVSPLVCDGVVYYAGPQTVACKIPDQPADKPEFKRLWSAELEGEFFSSPLCSGGILYAVSNQGFLCALDLKTGGSLYNQHIDIPSQSSPPGVEPASIYPSLALAAGRLFVGNDAGYTLVVAPGKEYRKLGENRIDEGSGSSPAFAGKLVFLRGGEYLYCIGAKQP
jgi:outer membrane protein assembly factor BamB